MIIQIDLSIMKEVIVYRYPRVFHIYNVVEYGRRWYRQLVFSSDPDLCLHDLKTDYLFIRGKLSLCCGDPRLKYVPEQSLIIQRDVKAGSSVSQTFFPSRLLAGIMPSSLLNQYKFWQNEDDSLIGYMPVLESNKAITRSILNVDILRVGLRDSTGYCNALADALISRVFLVDNIPSQTDSEKEFDTRPENSKPTEHLVNLMAVMSHYVKKFNNSGVPEGQTCSMQGR